MSNQTKMNFSNGLIIYTNPTDLTEGLFGQVFLHLFEIMPWLEANQLIPTWEIASHKYGREPDYLIIPGLLEPVREAGKTDGQRVSLADIRLEHAANLGGDWHYANRLWNSFFKFPQRVVERANSFGPLKNTLALHYRGTDKNLDPIHTNPVSQEDFLMIVDDFLSKHAGINSLFIATDQDGFTQAVKARYASTMTIIETGKVDFWRDVTQEANQRKGDHALMDCLLLSKCAYMLKCQSALSGFAKVLNPDQLAYRVAASKPFFYGIPYFPDAYVDRYRSDNQACRKILDRLFVGDWLDNPEAFRKYGSPFAFQPREEAARLMIPLEQPRQSGWREKMRINSVKRWLSRSGSKPA